MRRKPAPKRLHTAYVLCVLLAATTLAAQDSARMEQVVQSFVPNRFMGAVLVAKEDRILLPLLGASDD